METTDNSAPCIVLAAGGTGGHLFPAYALAEELGRRGYVVDLATDMRGDRYDMGFPARAVHQLPSATVAGASPVSLAKTAWALSRGIKQAYALLGKLHPRVVVGFGGYPSFPPVMAATLRGVPTLLHEQNAVLGRANRMLSSRVTAIATSFETVKHLEGSLAEKARLTGNPVRSVVIEAAQVPYQAPWATGPFHLLVFGGSQGARFFSEMVPPALAGMDADFRSRLRVIQQCRAEDIDGVRAAYAAAEIAAVCEPFFPDLPKLIADSHLVIGRGGASTIAELAVIGRPSVLVPLPHALDNDQLYNATSLASAGGAICIEQAKLDPETLRSGLMSLISEPDQLVTAANAARSQGRPDAVSRLADVVEELAAASPQG